MNIENMEFQRKRVIRQFHNKWAWYEYFKAGWTKKDAVELMNENNIVGYELEMNEGWLEYYEAYIKRGVIPDIQ